MRYVVLTVAVVLLIGGALLSLPPANAGPPQPYNLYGRAFEADGITPLPVGTQITTWIDGVPYGNVSAIFTASGDYDVDVFGNWVTDIVSPNTPEIKEGGDVGDLILVAAGDFATTAQVFTANKTWSPGDLVNENLQLAPLAVQPPLLKIARIVTRPADGLPQYMYVCNPTTDFINANQFYLQKDLSGRYDGPIHSLIGLGTVPPGGLAYVNFTATLTLTPTGDNLKLVWVNPGPAFDGADVIVDRVEFNETGGTGTLFWEPGNTIASDAPAPDVGEETRRDGTCTDTNDSAADFTIAAESGRPVGGLGPTVELVTPNGGEDWTGGTMHTIIWNMADSQDSALDYTIELDLNGGADGYPIFVDSGNLGTGAGRTFAWIVPRENSTTARIRVCVVNTFGFTSCDASAANFIIDSAAPSVTAIVPADAAADVDVLADFVITFDEAMNRVTTQSAVTLTPAAGTFSFSWDPGSTVLTISHVPLRVSTSYTLTIGTTATDGSLPGNTLSAPVTVDFATSSVIPVTAEAGPDQTAQVGETVQFDGAGSTGPVDNYTWEIRAPGGGSILLYGPQPTFRPTVAGVFNVTLAVRDAGGNEDQDFATLTVTGSLLDALANFAWLILIVVAGLAFLLILLFRRRRRAEQPPPTTRPRGVEGPKPIPPERVEVTPVAPPPRMEVPPATAGPAPGPRPGTKMCPACGTIVDAGDPACFMCGAKF